MKQILIKKWIDGEFREVKRYSEEDIVSIRHHIYGLEIILKGNMRLYDTQCIIEFEEEGSKDERIRQSLIKSYTNQHQSNFPTVDGFTREQIIAWLEKQGEQNPTWSEEDERMLQKALSTIRHALLIPGDKEDEPCFGGSSTISWLKSLKERMKGE